MNLDPLADGKGRSKVEDWAEVRRGDAGVPWPAGVRVIQCRPRNPGGQGPGRAGQQVPGDLVPARAPFASPGDFNGQLGVWLARANQRHHRRLGCRPVERWRPIGPRCWRCRRSRRGTRGGPRACGCRGITTSVSTATTTRCTPPQSGAAWWSAPTSSRSWSPSRGTRSPTHTPVLGAAPDHHRPDHAEAAPGCERSTRERRAVASAPRSPTETWPTTTASSGSTTADTVQRDGALIGRAS